MTLEALNPISAETLKTETLSHLAPVMQVLSHPIREFSQMSDHALNSLLETAQHSPQLALAVQTLTQISHTIGEKLSGPLAHFNPDLALFSAINGVLISTLAGMATLNLRTFVSGTGISMASAGLATLSSALGFNLDSQPALPIAFINMEPKLTFLAPFLGFAFFGLISQTQRHYRYSADLAKIGGAIGLAAGIAADTAEFYGYLPTGGILKMLSSTFNFHN